MRLSWPEIRANAARFSEDWAGKGYEKGQTQSFYDEFFAIFGVPRKQVAVYEQRVRIPVVEVCWSSGKPSRQ